MCVAFYNVHVQGLRELWPCADSICRWWNAIIAIRQSVACTTDFAQICQEVAATLAAAQKVRGQTIGTVGACVAGPLRHPVRFVA